MIFLGNIGTLQCKLPDFVDPFGLLMETIDDLSFEKKGLLFVFYKLFIEFDYESIPI